MHYDTRLEIEERLSKAFTPISLQVIDDSRAHQNHAEARLRPQAGHYKVIMQSTQFDGLNQIKRHRLVYEQLSELMDTKIHALSLQLYASQEELI